MDFLEYLLAWRLTNLHFDIKPHNILSKCKAKESYVLTMTGRKRDCRIIHFTLSNVQKLWQLRFLISLTFVAMECRFLKWFGARKNPKDNEGVKQISSKEIHFPDWIYNNVTQSEIDSGGWWDNTKEEEEIVRKMLMVVGLLQCIQTLPDDRPSMHDRCSCSVGRGQC